MLGYCLDHLEEAYATPKRSEVQIEDPMVTQLVKAVVFQLAATFDLLESYVVSCYSEFYNNDWQCMGPSGYGSCHFHYIQARSTT